MMRLSLFKVTVVSCFLFYSVWSFGQTTTKENDLDKKYTPGQNSIFNNLNKKNSRGSSSAIEIKNAVKYCPTMLARLKAGFFYERQIYKGLSINLGVGKTFGKDIMETVAFSLLDQNQSQVLAADDMLLYSSYYGSSILLSAGLRIYYSGKTFDGGYVDFNYRTEAVDYKLNTTIYNQQVEGSRIATFKMNALTFGFGHVFVVGRKNNITHDFFGNFGVKFFEYSKYDEIEGVSAYGGYAPGSYRNSGRRLYARVISFNMGYVLGFGF